MQWFTKTMRITKTMRRRGGQRVMCLKALGSGLWAPGSERLWALGSTIPALGSRLPRAVRPHIRTELGAGAKAACPNKTNMVDMAMLSVNT